MAKNTNRSRREPSPVWVGTVGLAVAAIVIAGGMWWGLDRLTTTEVAKGDVDYRARIESIVAVETVLAAFTAGVFLYRRTRASEIQTKQQADQLDQQRQEHEAQTKQHQQQLAAQAEQHQQQLAQQRQEHETDRYGRGIERLGSDSLAVRIGGLYALEALAKDAPERWAEPVYNNLVTYLQDRTRPEPTNTHSGPPPGHGGEGSTQDATRGPSEEAGSAPVLRAPLDVETVLVILSRTRQTFDNNITQLEEDNTQTFTDNNQPVPTTGVHLVGVDLRGHALTGTNFLGATLTGTNFREATLTNTSFYEATLTNTSFWYATLTRTSFWYATLTRTSFRAAILTSTGFPGATLTNTDFEEATLTDTDFYAATLTDTYFDHAHLTNTSFWYATLTHTRFRAANLTSTDFRAANLTSTDFRAANLTDTDFHGATLTDTDFHGATLTDTDFGGGTLTGTNFEKATVSGRVVGPSGVLEAIEDDGRDLTRATIKVIGEAGEEE